MNVSAQQYSVWIETFSHYAYNFGNSNKNSVNPIFSGSKR